MEARELHRTLTANTEKRHDSLPGQLLRLRADQPGLGQSYFLFIIHRIDVDWKVFEVQDAARLHRPALFVERLGQQGGTSNGRIAPEVVIAVWRAGHLFIGKLIDRLRVVSKR